MVESGGLVLGAIQRNDRLGDLSGVHAGRIEVLRSQGGDEGVPAEGHGGLDGFLVVGLFAEQRHHVLVQLGKFADDQALVVIVPDDFVFLSHGRLFPSSLLHIMEHLGPIILVSLYCSV